MDPLRIAVRALWAFVFLLTMIRISGKRTIKQGTSFDFILAVVVGDMIDDFIWADVSASVFVTAVGTFVAASIVSGALTWQARPGGR